MQFVLPRQPAVVAPAWLQMPQHLTLTEEAALRLEWCRQFVHLVARQCDLEALPRRQGNDEPLIVVGDPDDPLCRLPLAALLVFSEQGESVATTHLENVLALAEPGIAHLVTSFTQADAGKELTVADAERFDGGEVELALCQTPESPYLGYLFWCGQWLIASSPEIPKLPTVLPGLVLPDLHVIEHPRHLWPSLHQLCRAWRTSGKGGPCRDRAVEPTHFCRRHQPARKSYAPAQLRQFTFVEVRETQRALGNGPTRQYWKEVEGENALAHAIPGQTLEVVFRPSARLIDARKPADPQYEALYRELATISFDAQILLAVCLSLAIENGGTLDTTMDDLMRRIGWDPRSVEKRADYRKTLWRWLCIFDSLQVVGCRPGKYHDPLTKATLDLDSRDDLLHVLGERTTDTRDSALPPIEVSLLSGPWIRRFKDNHQVLSSFGDLRTLAEKPRGQIGQRLAVQIGLSLNQLWREQATSQRTETRHAGEENRLTIRYAPVTRKRLLTTYGHEPSREVEEMLESEHPQRAFEAWDDAIRLLKEWNRIGHYREVQVMPEARREKKPFWYERQELDIRPSRDDAQQIADVRETSKRSRTNPRRKGHR